MQVPINWPEERLISIRGTIVEFVGVTVIQSLTLITNLNTYGPFGVTDGTAFEDPIEEGAEIVGFHGHAGAFLDAIGQYVVPFN